MKIVELKERKRDRETSYIIMIIWSKMAQLGLEESSDVEGFRRAKYTEIKAELLIRHLGISYTYGFITSGPN